jgi:hypothetical protein
MLAQYPHIGVLSALLHPSPEPLDALSHVFRSALVPSWSPLDEIVFVSPRCGIRSVGSRGGGNPRDFDGSVALTEDVFVVVVRAARRVILSLALSG